MIQIKATELAIFAPQKLAFFSAINWRLMAQMPLVNAKEFGGTWFGRRSCKANSGGDLTPSKSPLKFEGKGINGINSFKSQWLLKW